MSSEFAQMLYRELGAPIPSNNDYMEQRFQYGLSRRELIENFKTLRQLQDSVGGSRRSSSMEIGHPFRGI